jgi:hypothetical protein
MSKQDAKDFFTKLESDGGMQTRIKPKLEEVAKKEKKLDGTYFDVTEEELNEELRNRWTATTGSRIVYSEPPGF